MCGVPSVPPWTLFQAATVIRDLSTVFVTDNTVDRVIPVSEMRKLLLDLGVRACDLEAVFAAAGNGCACEALGALKARARKRYHQLALELHPDRTGGDEAKADRFRRLSAVYEEFMETQPPASAPASLVRRHGISITFSAGGFGCSVGAVHNAVA